jgi:hypothetical protein
VRPVACSVEGLAILPAPSLLLLLPPNAVHDASLGDANRARAADDDAAGGELCPTEAISTRAQAVAVRRAAGPGEGCASIAGLALEVIRGAVCPNTQVRARSWCASVQCVPRLSVCFSAAAHELPVRFRLRFVDASQRCYLRRSLHVCAARAADDGVAQGRGGCRGHGSRK